MPLYLVGFVVLKLSGYIVPIRGKSIAFLLENRHVEICQMAKY